MNFWKKNRIVFSLFLYALEGKMQRNTILQIQNSFFGNIFVLNSDFHKIYKMSRIKTLLPLR